MNLNNTDELYYIEDFMFALKQLVSGGTESSDMLRRRYDAYSELIAIGDLFLKQQVPSHMIKALEKLGVSLRHSVKANNQFGCLFPDMLQDAHRKSEAKSRWESSLFRKLISLGPDEKGRLGEQYIARLLQVWVPESNAHIDGLGTKMSGGGFGDGTVKGWTLEVKTATLANSGSSFQHEFSATPWKADYVLFLDIGHSGEKDRIYITIFKNFTKEHWKQSGSDKKAKCGPCFPSRTITHRQVKNSEDTGGFKLDTSVVIDRGNCEKGCSFEINPHDEVGDKFRDFINKNIPTHKTPGDIPPDVPLLVAEPKPKNPKNQIVCTPELLSRWKDNGRTGKECKMTIDQLKALLRHYGLKLTGKRAELVDRLKDADV